MDFLIESQKINSTTIKFSNKFGFLNPEEFEYAIKFIATIYKDFTINAITEEELISHFAHLNQDLQQSVVDVLNTRRSEIEEFLISEYNSRKDNLLISFDWELKWIMGNNNLAADRSQLAKLILNCRNGNDKFAVKTIDFEMNQKKLNELIRMLEECEKQLNVN